MPARVVRGEINASESLSRVSLFADLLFRALIVHVDDYGRTDARPEVLSSHCFPLRKNVGAEKIRGALVELASGDDPPIMLYEVNGRSYLELTGWEKHRGKARRAKHSKWPAPHPRRSAEILGSLGDPPEGRGDEGTRDEGTRGREVASKRRSTPFPDPFPDAMRKALIVWGQGKGFSEPQCDYAIERVREKSGARDYRNVDWLRAIQGYMREGWALTGYQGPEGSGETRLGRIIREEAAKLEEERHGHG